MATALMVTIIASSVCGENNAEHVSITSQVLTFVDVKPAERALEQIKEAHSHMTCSVQGVILKDVVI